MTTRYSATYSPEDNKLRLTASARLDRELYERVRKTGFIWAPKQQLFVAPMWTPEREDLLLELCEEIGDEDTSLVDRAEERAERFEGYSERRESDAHAAKATVERITSGIPLGQPILVGHHSERRARRDAERIENGMRKAVKMWETSKYWERRAVGAVAAAKYKERPDVRATRIARLEADQRKKERISKEASAFLALWKVDGLTIERAKHLANYPGCGYGTWSDLNAGKMTAAEAQSIVVPSLERTIENCRRWLLHLSMRLVYERCMLDESGWIAPERPKSLKETLPLLNYRQEVIEYPNEYRSGELMRIPQVEMTKAQYAKVYKDYKGTRIVERSHKVRIAVIRSSFFAVFLTDSKVHVKPAPGAEPPLPAPRIPRPARPAPERTEFDALKDSLKAGVAVVSAPQLFPTPYVLAIRMARKADIRPGHAVLEPSAGTGRLLWAINEVCAASQVQLHAVEINDSLARSLRAGPIVVALHQGDFLEMGDGDLGRFDRVVMNPPFSNGQDVAHILHAVSLLKPGGRLVALCANGRQQAAKLEPLADSWEELPPGSFVESGTNVNVVLATFVKAEAA